MNIQHAMLALCALAFLPDLTPDAVAQTETELSDEALAAGIEFGLWLTQDEFLSDTPETETEPTTGIPALDLPDPPVLDTRKYRSTNTAPIVMPRLAPAQDAVEPDLQKKPVWSAKPALQEAEPSENPTYDRLMRASQTSGETPQTPDFSAPPEQADRPALTPKSDGDLQARPFQMPDQQQAAEKAVKSLPRQNAASNCILTKQSSTFLTGQTKFTFQNLCDFDITVATRVCHPKASDELNTFSLKAKGKKTETYGKSGSSSQKSNLRTAAFYCRGEDCTPAMPQDCIP